MAVCNVHQMLQAIRNLKLGGSAADEQPTDSAAVASAVLTAQLENRTIAGTITDSFAQTRTIVSIINCGDVPPDEAEQLIGKSLDLAAGTSYETIPTPLPECLVVRDSHGQAWSFFVTADAEPITDDTADNLS